MTGTEAFADADGAPDYFTTGPGGELPACLADVGEGLKDARQRASLTQKAVAATLGVTQTAVSYWEDGKRDISVAGLIRAAEVLGVPASSLLPAKHQEPSAASAAPDGRWLHITFFGHNEYTGYVIEVTKHGQPAYRIDLPEKIWGGNPLACITYAASSWFSDYPVTEESVRKAWEAERERDWLRAREAAEWKREREQRALEAAAGSDEGDDDWTEKEPF